MKGLIHPRYKAQAAAIKRSIEHFDTTGEEIRRDRNVVKRFELDTEHIAIKQFKRPNWVNRFVYPNLRPSKAARSYRYAERLLEMGIQTPKPIAYFENLGIKGLKDSYYVAELLDYDLTLRTLLHQPQYPDRKKILRQFSTFTHALHEKGIHFLDHSPGNTLIVKRAADYDFYLVDLNRMRFEHLNWERRMKNFARLSLTPDMIDIISETYAGLSGETPEKTRAQITARSQQATARQARKKALKKWLKL